MIFLSSTRSSNLRVPHKRTWIDIICWEIAIIKPRQDICLSYLTVIWINSSGKNAFLNQSLRFSAHKWIMVIVIYAYVMLQRLPHPNAHGNETSPSRQVCITTQY